MKSGLQNSARTCRHAPQGIGSAEPLPKIAIAVKFRLPAAIAEKIRKNRKRKHTDDVNTAMCTQHKCLFPV